MLYTNYAYILLVLLKIFKVNIEIIFKEDKLPIQFQCNAIFMNGIRKIGTFKKYFFQNTQKVYN